MSIASITFDSTDPEPLARWWAERFDAEITANMDGFFVIVAGGSLPAQLAFQRVDDPTPGKNKLHLDVHTDDDLDAEVARWTEAGATSLGETERRGLFVGHAHRSRRQRVLHRRQLTGVAASVKLPRVSNMSFRSAAAEFTAGTSRLARFPADEAGVPTIRC